MVHIIKINDINDCVLWGIRSRKIQGEINNKKKKLLKV